MRAASFRLVLILAVLTVTVLSAGPALAQQLAPTELRATTSGSNVVIGWRAAGTAAPDGFRLEAGSGPGLADLAVVNIPWNASQGLEAQFRAAGVAPGLYYLRVRGVYGRALSAASEEIVMRVGASSCPLPNAPRNIHARVGGELVTLDWEPAGDGGPAAGYVIEAGSTPGAPNVAIITIDNTHVSVSAPPGRYFVRLRAIGLCGASEPSPEVVIVVP